MTANPTGFFVQFPHPGLEHNPTTDDIAWNTGHHRRKFLIAPGRYLDGDDQMDAADLVFWAEWEPPSRVERRWPASGRLPRALHRPYWGEPTRRVRQNTDPRVWGDPMIYSNCKQVSPERRPTSMQRLTRGSVICFGSTIEGEFCVDTVFVVASATDAWRERYAHRAGIEGTTAQASRRSDLHQARYPGLAKTHLQHVLTALALNLVRIDAWLASIPPSGTWPSRLTRLRAEPSPV